MANLEISKSKFLTDSRNLNIAIVFFIFPCITLAIAGSIYAIFGTFMQYHIEYTGLTESEVAAYNSRLMFLISVLIRLLGVNMIAVGISILYITIYGIRKRKKWAWTSILLITIICTVPTLILTSIVVGIFGWAYLLYLFGTILLIIGLYLSYKEIF
ncbi:MAG: hypothetical protein ACFFAO_04690 [Candidatus Hermodarchaeota archaeon]